MEMSTGTALLNNENILTFCEKLPAGVLLLNDSGRVIFANSHLFDFVSTTEQDLIGTTVAEHLYKDDQAAFSLWLNTFGSKFTNLTTFVARYESKSGEMGLIKFTKSAQPSTTPSGFQIILASPNTDADWKPVDNLAENPLWTLLTDALDASPQGFNIWQGIRGASGEIERFKLLFMNRIGAAPHKSTTEDLIGKDLDEIFPENREEGFFQALLECSKSKKVSELVLESSKNANWPGTFANVIIPLSDDRVANSFREVSEEMRELRTLQDQATLDAVTGILNRAAFDSLLNTELNDFATYSQPLAVCYLDIDNFKSVNDRFGHDAGDFVLRMFAERMQGSLRIGDIVGRLGGDEFAILLSGLKNVGELEGICKRISARVNTNVIWNGQMIEITASIGVAFHEGTTSILSSNILREADQAMYLAKKAGKKQYRIVKIS